MSGQPLRSHTKVSPPTASIAVCVADVADFLFVDEAAYAVLSTWLEARLHELECRFADFVTVHSQQLSCHHRGATGGSRTSR